MANINRQSPQDAQKLIAEQGYTYVDVRTEAEYSAGHPTGALNVPVALAVPGGMQPNPDFLRVMGALFAKDAKIVVGCKMGGRSLQAAALLEAAGYSSVVDMRGGFHGERDNLGRVAVAGWAESGLPVEASAPPDKTYTELEKRASGK